MEIAANLFSNGLNLDQHPLTVDNTTLTDALNATFLTKNGNELMLQNDMGNTLIQDSRTGRIMGLSEGFVPLGIKEYGGVLYIASYNPETELGELGSIPSPLITYTIGEELKNNDVSVPLTKDNYTENELYNSTLNNYVKISDCKLKPGDAFYIVLELDRCIDKIQRSNEICGYIDDNKLAEVPEKDRNESLGDIKNLCIEDNINKSIFSCSDLGKGLFNVELYTKTQSHGILPLEGILNKEVQYYVKKDPQIKNSNYWFIDRYKLQNDDNASNQFDDLGNLNLDMKRSISAESFLNYPNYPSGYLCTKLSPILPQIDGMLINKSTGIKSPYLYMGTENKVYKWKEEEIQFYELQYKENDSNTDLIGAIQEWLGDNYTDSNRFLEPDDLTDVNKVGDIIGGKIIFTIYKEEKQDGNKQPYNNYTLLLLGEDLQTISTIELNENISDYEEEYYKFLVWLAIENSKGELDTVTWNSNEFASFDKLKYITKLLPQYTNYYYIVIPGFYCNSGALTIDKIKLARIEKNGILFDTNCKILGEEGCITRVTGFNTNKIELVSESKFSNLELPKTFVQIFDINTHKDKSIICPNNTQAIEVMLNKTRSISSPGNMLTADNYGLFAFLIEEKDLNSTFKMTFEFYSQIPKSLAEHSGINESFLWDLSNDESEEDVETPYYECLVLTKDFYYTPRAILLDSYTVLQADNVLLNWPDENTPELILNKDVLFGIDGKNNVYNITESGYESKGLTWNSDSMGTYYQYPFIKTVYEENKDAFYGFHTAIGPDYGGFDKNWYDTRTNSWLGNPAETADYRASVISCVNKWNLKLMRVYSNSDRTYMYRNKMILLNDANKTKTNTLGLTKDTIRGKGFYKTNSNWFNNILSAVTFKTTREQNEAVSIYLDGSGYPYLKNLPFGGIDKSQKGGNGTSNEITYYLPESSFYDVPFQRSKGMTFFDGGEEKVCGGGSHKLVCNFMAFNYLMRGSGEAAYNYANRGLYPITSPYGNKIGSEDEPYKRFGKNRYIEWLFCFMKDFCPTAPIYVKGPTTVKECLIHNCLNYEIGLRCYKEEQSDDLITELKKEDKTAFQTDKLAFNEDTGKNWYTDIGIFYKDPYQIVTDYKINNRSYYSNDNVYNLSYLYKKPFNIEVINKSDSHYKVYNLVNETPSGVNDEDTWGQCIHYLGVFIGNGGKNVFRPTKVSYNNLSLGKTNVTLNGDLNSSYDILLNNYKYQLVNYAYINAKDTYLKRRSSGLVATIPSYLLFIDVDTLDIKKNEKTDRMITPYFYVANTKNQPFNSNLGVEQDRLVSEQTCNQNYWKYEILSLTPPTESMCKHTTSENWTRSNTLKLKAYRVDSIDGDDDKDHVFPNLLDISIHILKVNGCQLNNDGKCYFEDPVTIKKCTITYSDDEGEDLIFNNDSKEWGDKKINPNVTDYLVFKVPNECTDYEVELTFTTDVVIKDVFGFDYLLMDSSTNWLYDSETEEDVFVSMADLNYESGFYFTQLKNKDEIIIEPYPLFPEYYVYCEDGIKCANTTFRDIPQYPADPYARVYGYYTIRPVEHKEEENKPNDYYNSNSPILYDCVKEFYKSENDKSDSIPMQTIKTYSSYYKD